VEEEEDVLANNCSVLDSITDPPPEDREEGNDLPDDEMVSGTRSNLEPL
jgi:hypothetical protein